MQSRSREHTASGKSAANGIKQALLGNAISEAKPAVHRVRQKTSRQNLKLAELRPR
jgi:hypothetical protein